jgi:2-polyprenyl-3-methyl-5-hydroxy-6-metoxy-1,4-benzoquinol methylase
VSDDSYERYLLSKKTVDDRAFNRIVLEYVTAELRRFATGTPVRVLEIGAGIGTMIARLVDWKVLTHADCTAVDVDPAFLNEAREWLTDWGRRGGLQVSGGDEVLRFRSDEIDLSVRFVAAEISEFLRSAATMGRFDFLIACAFLDLVELPATLERLFALLQPGGLYWFPSTTMERPCSHRSTLATPNSCACTTRAWTIACGMADPPAIRRRGAVSSSI